jgi:hypothetical protein
MALSAGSVFVIGISQEFEGGYERWRQQSQQSVDASNMTKLVRVREMLAM